ncbi:MAG: hypothetical protein ABIQ64_03070 [Candidatus Saccharimonadales bacterium]
MAVEAKEKAEDKKLETKYYSRKRRVLSLILWIIGWPIIIGFVGFLIAVTVGNAIVEVGNMNSPQGYQIRGLWAAYVGVLVITCYFFIWRKSRETNPLKRISSNVLRTYMWIGIILGVSITAIIPDPEVSSANAGINVQQTNTLFKPNLQSDTTINLSLAKVGAIDTEWVETKFVVGSDYKLLHDQGGEYQAFVDTAGNWSYGVLTVKQGTSGDTLDSVVAHEYLHHIWFKTLDDATKTKLTSDLISIYGHDSVMQERVKPYTQKQILQPTELFSFYCTEASDPYLTSYIVSECNKHINRSVLQFPR